MYITPVILINEAYQNFVIISYYSLLSCSGPSSPHMGLYILWNYILVPRPFDLLAEPRSSALGKGISIRNLIGYKQQQ